MKKTIYKLIDENEFNGQVFDELYIRFQKTIENESSLIFKSIHVDNINAFSFLIKKVEWKSHFQAILWCLLKKDSFIDYYDVLKTFEPSFIYSNQIQTIIFNTITKNYSWIHNKNNKKERFTILQDLVNQGFYIQNPFDYEKILQHPELHFLIFQSIEKGTPPKNLNNFFAEFCERGNPIYLDLFKTIGCDFHYLNDLPLINAAKSKNEPMIIHLIKEENADPFVSNGFVFKTILSEDDVDEVQASNELVLFLAEIINQTPKVSKSLLKILNLNKRFNTSLNYLNLSSLTQKHTHQKTSKTNRKI